MKEKVTSKIAGTKRAKKKKKKKKTLLQNESKNIPLFGQKKCGNRMSEKKKSLIGAVPPQKREKTTRWY